MKYINSNTNNKRNKELYEVDKIITRKIKKGKKFYLIKWEGYSIRYCSWEPLSHLNNILEMVEDFERNYPESIDKIELKHFLREYKSYQMERNFLKKKFSKIKKLKTYDSIKIIINLNELENSNNNKKENEEQNNIIEFPIGNKEKEIETEKQEKNSENKFYNENNFGKLIQPTIIW